VNKHEKAGGYGTWDLGEQREQLNLGNLFNLFAGRT